MENPDPITSKQLPVPLSIQAELRASVSSLPDHVLPALGEELLGSIIAEFNEALIDCTSEEQSIYFLSKGFYRVAEGLTRHLSDPDVLLAHPQDQFSYERTLLTFALELGRERAVSYCQALLANNADPDQPDSRGNYPLQLLCQTIWDVDSFVTLADSFREAGADFQKPGLGLIGWMVQKFKDRESGSLGSKDIQRMIDTLLELQVPIDDIDAKPPTQRTALAIAIELDARALANHLIDKGADVTFHIQSERASNACFPLIEACEKGMHTTALKMLQRGANPEQEQVSSFGGSNRALRAALRAGNERLGLAIVENTSPAYLSRADAGYNGLHGLLKVAKQRGMHQLAQALEVSLDL